MSRTRTSGVVALLVTCCIGFCAGDDKITLDVYYESLCPDSENFIVKQLNPTIKALGNYIDLNLIPFGKSSISADGSALWCQHGLAECNGNRVQDCALQYANSDVLKTDYVTCEMITRAGSRGSFQCVADYNLPVAEVEACFTSTTGLALQLESQRKTQIFKPTFVPTIVINGVFNQSIQDRAFRNLAGTLCDLLSISDSNICA